MKPVKATDLACDGVGREVGQGGNQYEKTGKNGVIFNEY